MKWRQIRGKNQRIQNFLGHSVNSLPGVSFYIKEEATVKDGAPAPHNGVDEKTAEREERT